MIPAVNPAYCNIGAGVAKAASGRIVNKNNCQITPSQNENTSRKPLEG